MYVLLWCLHLSSTIKCLLTYLLISRHADWNISPPHTGLIKKTAIKLQYKQTQSKAALTANTLLHCLHYRIGLHTSSLNVPWVLTSLSMQRAECTENVWTLVLFCSSAILDPHVVSHTVNVLSPIYRCPLPFWLTLPWWALSTSWCCPSRLCVVFLACVHLTLLLAFSLSPGNSLVSSRCDHSMLASLLWQYLI